MKKIKITFSDFWPNFVPTDNYFYNLLSLKYEVIVDDINPDIVFHSVYSKNHMKYDMNRHIKILYTGENYRPRFEESHYSLSFDYTNDKRNYRLPLWALILNWFDRPYNPNRDHAYLHNIDQFLNKKIWNKDKFCAFVVSNPNAQERINFARKVNQYKNIDCPGRVFTNVNPILGRGDQIEKVEFLRDYKFNICFENSSNPGYCTEKIIHSMFMNSLPIYWGDPLVYKDFNKDSFLNLNDFESEEHLIQRIIEIDNDDKIYKEIINQPWFIDNKIPDFIKPESVLSFFEKIINNI
jgi:hypothetical protein